VRAPSGCGIVRRRLVNRSERMMFAEPTINDFLDSVRWHLNKALWSALGLG
jgi:hypothetical protein